MNIEGTADTAYEHARKAYWKLKQGDQYTVIPTTEQTLTTLWPQVVKALNTIRSRQGDSDLWLVGKPVIYRAVMNS